MSSRTASHCPVVPAVSSQIHAPRQHARGHRVQPLFGRRHGRRLTQRAARSNAAGLESSGVRLHRLHDRLNLLESGVAGARSLGFALKRSMRVSAACAYVRGMVRGAAERIALQRSFTGEK